MLVLNTYLVCKYFNSQIRLFQLFLGIPIYTYGSRQIINLSWKIPLDFLNYLLTILIEISKLTLLVTYLFRSLSRMTEGEKSSGEPWNKRLSQWFSRGTKNRHMIGLFKWKFCSSPRVPPITNMRGRKSFLLLEILVIKIKRSRNTEEIV